MALALPNNPVPGGLFPHPGHPAHAWPLRHALHAFRLRHPEALPAVVVLAAWGALVMVGGQGARSGTSMSGGSMAGGSMPGMPGMAAPDASPWWSQALSGLPFWLLMVVAMMGPAALGGLRHTAINSLRWRHLRAMAEYAASYLAVWALFGLVVLALVAAVPRLSGSPALAMTLAGSAAWQLSGVKRRSLRACHRSVPLPARGWAAERGALAFGWRNGLACLGSCWCLMLAMAVVPTGQLLWMAGLTVLVTAERWVERPRRVTRGAVPLLGLAGLGAAAAALI